MRQFTRWFYLLASTIRLFGHFARAWVYWKTKARHDLNLPSDQLFSNLTVSRWRHYFYGTTFLSAVFCRSRGRNLNLVERRRFSRLAALACAFDDSAERFGHQVAVPACPEAMGLQFDDDGLALHLLQLVYAEIPPESWPAFRADLNQVYQLEVSDSKQLDLRSSETALAGVTKQKGGFSVRLFRRLLDNAPNAADEALAFALGGFVQFCDDIFDSWFDRKNQTPTLAVFFLEKNAPEQLRAIFEDQLTALYRTIRQMPGTRYRRETTVCTVHFLASITRVCLRHYQLLKKKHGTLPLDNRKAMVVDMARWLNQWLTIKALVTPVNLEFLKNEHHN